MATIIVNTLTDENDGVNVGLVSLRDAIAAANATGTDTIEFDPSLSGSTIVLTNGELQIINDVTITGLGANLLTIDAGGNSRVFNIDDGNSTPDQIVALSGLTITGGNASGDGGGIFNAEDLTLANITIKNNSSSLAGGGIANVQAATATITNSTISGNISGAKGGGISNNAATSTVINSTLSGNLSGSFGGGIANDPGSTFYTSAENWLSPLELS